MNIQAITDCTIWKLSRQDLAHLYNISLNLNKIARVFFRRNFYKSTSPRNATIRIILRGSIQGSS